MKKKIIFVLYSLSVGGAERRAASIANYLADNGFEVEILLLDNPNVKFEIDERIKVVFLSNNKNEETISNNVETFVVVSKPTSLKTKLDLKKYKLINHRKYLALEQLEYLKQHYADKIQAYVKNKPDFTVVSWMTFSNISTCCALKDTENEKIIVECTTPEAEFSVDHPANMLKEDYYPFANKIICQTPDEANYYDFLPNAKKYVIPNPINGNYPDRYSGKRKKAIVNFCRLEPPKDIPLLIDAFNILHLDYPEYELHIFGEGSQKDSLKNYARDLNLEESIQFFDFDVNIHDRIKDYAMFVSSSDREGMSNSMLEAMAIGLPTISTDCPAGAARMLIKNYVNGIVVPMRDANAMYEAMKYIIEHPKETESMSIESTRIREKLSMERIGQMWIDAIME